MYKSTSNKLTCEIFESPRPDDYESIIDSADKLFAELLIKHYFSVKKDLTIVNYYGNLSKKGEIKND